MISAADIGAFVGALIATFLVSRLVLWLLREWKGGPDKVFTAHCISLFVIAILAGMGMADGGAFAPLDAAAIYAVPQIVWLVVDQIRYSKMEREEPQADVTAPPSPTPQDSPVNGHPSISTPTSAEKRIEALERLSALRASGALTVEEFEHEKQRILSS